MVRFIHKVRNLFSKIVMHIFGVMTILWVSGVMTAYFTNQTGSVDFDLSTILITKQWATWLMSVWTKLPLEAYGYLKLKLSVSLFAPFILATILYFYYFNAIRSWTPV